MNRLYTTLLTNPPSFLRRQESSSLTPNGHRSECPLLPHPFALSLSKGFFVHPRQATP